jgi:hypothetical protein
MSMMMGILGSPLILHRIKSPLPLPFTCPAWAGRVGLADDEGALCGLLVRTISLRESGEPVGFQLPRVRERRGGLAMAAVVKHCAAHRHTVTEKYAGGRTYAPGGISVNFTPGDVPCGCLD